MLLCVCLRQFGLPIDILEATWLSTWRLEAHLVDGRAAIEYRRGDGLGYRVRISVQALAALAFLYSIRINLWNWHFLNIL